MVARAAFFAAIEDGHLSSHLDDCSRDKGGSVCDAGFIDFEAGFKIITGINDNVSLCNLSVQVVAVEPFADSGYLGVRVECLKHVLCGFGLLLAYGFGGMDDLALQVAKFNVVSITDDKMPNAAACQVERDG